MINLSKYKDSLGINNIILTENRDKGMPEDRDGRERPLFISLHSPVHPLLFQFSLFILGISLLISIITHIYYRRKGLAMG